MSSMTRANDQRLTDFGIALEAITRVQKAFDRSLRASTPIGQGFLEALLRIERSGGTMTMGELADQILLTSGGVTRLVDRLADEGYACRQPCPEDRRVQYVAITDAGRVVLDEALGVHISDLQRLYFDHMTDDERRLVVEVLDRIRQAESGCRPEVVAESSGR